MVVIQISSPGASKVVFMTTIYATGDDKVLAISLSVWLGGLEQTYSRFLFLDSIKEAEQLSPGIMLSEGNVSIGK